MSIGVNASNGGCAHHRRRRCSADRDSASPSTEGETIRAADGQGGLTLTKSGRIVLPSRAGDVLGAVEWRLLEEADVPSGVA